MFQEKKWIGLYFCFQVFRARNIQKGPRMFEKKKQISNMRGGGDVGVWLNVDCTIFALPVWKNLQSTSKKMKKLQSWNQPWWSWHRPLTPDELNSILYSPWTYTYTYNCINSVQIIIVNVSRSKMTSYPTNKPAKS